MAAQTSIHAYNVTTPQRHNVNVPTYNATTGKVTTKTTPQRTTTGNDNIVNATKNNEHDQRYRTANGYLRIATHSATSRDDHAVEATIQ